jgi:membrane associated rhomboid family serine protease
MIPLSDENPTLHTPWMTWLIIGTTVAVWMVVQRAGSGTALPYSVCNLGLVPGELTHRVAGGTAVPLGDGLSCVVDREPINKFTPLISIFLHGSWGHLLGNMLFFWVFGNNIEDSMGPERFLVFYLLCGLVAVWAHVGGFLAGVVLIKLFENRQLVARRDEIREIEHPHGRRVSW